MPYANNDGVRIHYEVVGEGPPLVMMYGIGTKIHTWHLLSYVESLSGDFQLILIDTRGHGSSDKPHDPEAYSRRVLAADVVAVLDDLDLDKAHYLGYSMGGYIGYGIAQHAADRFYSLILGGTRLPWERDPKLPGVAIANYRLTEGTEAFMGAVAAVMAARMTSEWDADMRPNDLEALAGMLSAPEGILSHGFEDVVPHLTLPCLFFVGERDEDPYVREYIEGMPNATYVGFPGLDHLDAWFRTDLVLPHVRRFLAKVGEG